MGLFRRYTSITHIYTVTLKAVTYKEEYLEMNSEIL
jgi:hypothetical protein